MMCHRCVWVKQGYYPGNTTTIVVKYGLKSVLDKLFNDGNIAPNTFFNRCAEHQQQ